MTLTTVDTADANVRRPRIVGNQSGSRGESGVHPVWGSVGTCCLHKTTFAVPFMKPPLKGPGSITDTGPVVVILYDNNVCYLLQLPVPESVTRRYYHSVSTFQLGPQCVWLVVFGGMTCTSIVELGKH